MGEKYPSFLRRREDRRRKKGNARAHQKSSFPSLPFLFFLPFSHAPDSLLESKSLLKPLTPEDIVSSETILETNPLMRTIEVSSDWSSMAGVSCAFEDDEVDNRLGGMSLSGLKSVGYAVSEIPDRKRTPFFVERGERPELTLRSFSKLATCPAVTYLGVEQGFSSVKNVDGVTILDVWEALVAKSVLALALFPLSSSSSSLTLLSSVPPFSSFSTSSQSQRKDHRSSPPRQVRPRRESQGRESERVGLSGSNKVLGLDLDDGAEDKRMGFEEELDD